MALASSMRVRQRSFRARCLLGLATCPSNGRRLRPSGQAARCLAAVTRPLSSPPSTYGWRVDIPRDGAREPTDSESGKNKEKCVQVVDLKSRDARKHDQENDANADAICPIASESRMHRRLLGAAADGRDHFARCVRAQRLIRRHSARTPHIDARCADGREDGGDQDGPRGRRRVEEAIRP